MTDKGGAADDKDGAADDKDGAADDKDDAAGGKDGDVVANSFAVGALCQLVKAKEKKYVNAQGKVLAILAQGRVKFQITQGECDGTVLTRQLANLKKIEFVAAPAPPTVAAPPTAAAKGDEPAAAAADDVLKTFGEPLPDL